MLLPLGVLGSSWVGLAALVAATYSRLPQRVATHFDLHGVPNGWMDRSTHAWAMVAVGVGVPLLLLFANQKLAPLLLELILLILFIWLLKQLNQFYKLTPRA